MVVSTGSELACVCPNKCKGICAYNQPTLLCAGNQAIFSLWKQSSLYHCSTPRSREQNPILGPHQEAFVSWILMGGVIHMESDFPLLPSSVCLFEALSPFLLPPQCEFMCGWFSWAKGPAQLQLCLLFVPTALTSASDIPWSARPGTGAPN